MMFPAVLFQPFEILHCDSDAVYHTKFIFDDRVYAAPRSQQSKLPTEFAPNIHIGHEISFFPTLEFNYWKVSQKNFTGISPYEQISSMKLSGLSAGLFLRYTYQLPISQYFGIYVGTTTGALIAQKNDKNFKWGYGIFFPSIMGGFTVTPITEDRLNFGLEYNGIWYPEMAVSTNQYQGQQTTHQLAAMLSAWDFYLENDYFFGDKVAFLINGGVRLISNVCNLPGVCSNTNYLNTLNISDITYYAQTGFIFSVN